MRMFLQKYGIESKTFFRRIPLVLFLFIQHLLHFFEPLCLRGLTLYLFIRIYLNPKDFINALFIYSMKIKVSFAFLPALLPPWFKFLFAHSWLVKSEGFLRAISL